MADASGYHQILDKLQAYKRKYYQNKLIKGGLLALAILCSSYLLVNSLEYTIRFGTLIRGILFFGFLALIIWVLYRWIIDPAWKLLTLKQQISDEEAARQIGRYFPAVNDKLLNTLQLHRLSAVDNALIQASIAQKTQDVSAVPFVEAINFNENRKYLKYLVFPLSAVVIILLAAPQLFTDSTPRLINFNKTYAPVAPFQFDILNEDLRAFKNEDFNLTLGFTGDLAPNTVYLQTKDRRVKMLPNEDGHFEFMFDKVQSSFDFQFEAAGFSSELYTLEVRSRPNLKGFDIDLKYPRYLGRQNESLQNTGNLQIPEGTDIKWTFRALETEGITLRFQQSQEVNELQRSDDQVFTFEKTATESDRYLLDLRNEFSQNKEEIEYQINVIKDKYPKITLDQYRDTTMFSYMIFGGSISDDYGLSRLSLYYKVKTQTDESTGQYKQIPIPIKAGTNNQNYYFQWEVDSLNLELGDQVNYYLRVWDNDGVNGSKSTKTSQYAFKLPSRQEINESLDQNSKNTEKQIDKSLQDAKELNEKIQEAEEPLKD